MNDDLYRARRDNARQAIRQAGIGLLLVGPSASFGYLTGRRALLTERLVALAIGADGKDTIVCPRLQAPLYEDVAVIDMLVWDEADDPVRSLADLCAAQSASAVAFNDEFWSSFVLRLARLAPGLAMHGGELLGELRMRKDAGELARLRKAAERIDAVWAAFCDTAGRLAGQTEFALRKLIDGLMRDMGFSEVTWVDVGAGPNGASPLHHGSEHVIREGEPVVFDYAGCFDGYYGDICRVALTGKADPAYLELYELVHTAQEAAFQAIRPGVPAWEIDAVARNLFAARGLDQYFTHRLGHGIGMAAHEDPYIVAGNMRALAPGMTFSNEPGLYIPGKWGARIEDIVAVTETGGERLTQASRELVLLN
ncbi:M24 family metallopeptidase [Paraburkholderia tropica]|uniref:M24 family metallopeptidase n=1 Tax=Paraburkholderia tropica TaxID=92647 RepID=UPI002AB6C5E6|nr:Xaa-Pro peptidase family protein [Paraburkholderia tropica]